MMLSQPAAQSEDYILRRILTVLHGEEPVSARSIANGGAGHDGVGGTGTTDGRMASYRMSLLRANDITLI